MSFLARLLTSRWGPIVTGAVVGVLAPVLVRLGNPGNMGVCVACFSRDIAGSLGLHRAAAVQYIRPEIIGLVLCAMASALVFREFRPRTGSAPLVRFLLGLFAVIGALVFLGCPWRAYLRLSGGDWNSLYGILGLAAGIGIGIIFLRLGFSLGRNRPATAALGWVMPVAMGVLLLALVYATPFGRDAEGNPTGPIFLSAKGPGSEHAAIWISLGVGLIVGFLAQRSRFCTVGALRDLMLMRDPYLFNGVVALIVAALAANFVLGEFRPGFDAQPVSHTNARWNFAGMVLSGLAFTLAGGCPGRQLILSGEGDGDAAIFTLGMIVGAGFAHNFSLAGSPSGPGPFSAAAVVTGLVVCSLIGFVMREPPRS